MPSNGGYRVRQVAGVGFRLAGKVDRRERARIEDQVEDYIKQNYDVIKSHFAAQACQSSSSGAVQLCINRTNNHISIVKGEGVKDASVSSRNAGRNNAGKGNQRQRKLPLAADSSVEKESSATVTAITNSHNPSYGKASVSDYGGTGGTGESMEAAIEYLMARDSKANAEMRPLRSEVPKKQVSNVSVPAGSNNVKLTKTVAKSVLPRPKLQQQLVQKPKKVKEVKSTSASVSLGEHVGASIVSDTYDCAARGAAFRQLFSTLFGEFFIFYEHGETHCRSILTALGFRERSVDHESDQYRTMDEMSVMWCNGTISASKRKSGLGFHIVNRLRYRGLITNKCSLTRTMAEFESRHPQLIPKGLEASSFLPATIHLNGAEASDVFHKIRHSCMYLIKPGFSDCGKGIVIYRSDGNLAGLVDTLTTHFPNYTHKDLVLQRYIENPLLLGGKKFDLRVFLLAVPNQRKEVGVYAFVHPGYVRLACRNYDVSSNDITLHLTNQAIQHQDKTYKSVKENTVWSPDTLNQYLNKHRKELKVPCADWVKRRLYPRIRSIIAHLMSIVSSSLCEEPHSFELFGCDFLVDDKFNVWLLEVNSDPSLNKSTNVLKQIITQVVEEATGMAVEVIQRCVRGMPIKRLVTEQDFKKVFSHTNESVLRSVMAEAKVAYQQHLAK